MKRITQTFFTTDDGRDLIRIEGDKAKVIPCGCSADDLDELATACSAAADEMRFGQITAQPTTATE